MPVRMIPSPSQLVSTVFLLVISLNLSAAVCTTHGWFGPIVCLHQCHCDEDADCNKTSGSCPKGCHSGWFGPACQYESSPYNFKSTSSNPWSNVTWLTDNKMDTCNDGSAKTITVQLENPHPLTWVRIVLSGAGHTDQILLTYKSTETYGFVPCDEEKTTKVVERTLDILCSTKEAAVLVKIDGDGVEALCALYVSGGRNVALKQQSRQSSSFVAHIWSSRNAVDGNTAEPGASEMVLEDTCTQTMADNDSRAWWTVFFYPEVKVISFALYNRRRDNPFDINIGCCENRLMGFQLEAFQRGEDSAIYTYTDTTKSAQPIYTVVPQNRISEAVSRVKITTMKTATVLTLCEVFVFGEIVCPPGKFGLECDKQCNCANDQNVCFVSTGGCPSGCAPGYRGKDCQLSTNSVSLAQPPQTKKLGVSTSAAIGSALLFASVICCVAVIFFSARSKAIGGLTDKAKDKAADASDDSSGSEEWAPHEVSSGLESVEFHEERPTQQMPGDNNLTEDDLVAWQFPGITPRNESRRDGRRPSQVMPGVIDMTEDNRKAKRSSAVDPLHFGKWIIHGERPSQLMAVISEMIEDSEEEIF